MAIPPSRAGTKGVPRADRERQILSAATEEFGRRGYEATSLAAVAARVGVTKTLLHQYFGPKQDLYLACLAPVGDRLLAAIRAAMDAGGDARPPTPLRVLHNLFTALEGQRDGEPARLAAHYRAAVDELAAIGTLDVLHRTGPADAREADPLDADALAHAWRGLATALVRWWIKHPEESADAMERRCERLFAAARSGLGPGSP
jgi:AcrR family transcriptional regulator